jgi:hypothetical protein
MDTPALIRDKTTLVIIDPPWGDAFDAHGLDLGKTAPPIAEVLGALCRHVWSAPVSAMVKIHPMMVKESVDVLVRDHLVFETVKSSVSAISERVDYVLLRLQRLIQRLKLGSYCQRTSKSCWLVVIR